MIRKLVHKFCQEYFAKVLQPQIEENELSREEVKTAHQRHYAEVCRHNALVEGWLRVLLQSKNVDLPE